MLTTTKNKINIIGGGLAGCEAAYQLLKRGYEVDLYEMRGETKTPCHKTDKLAELVCSNSLKATALDTASGLLKAELENLDCLLVKMAYKASVPAGGALAVDRLVFSECIEEVLNSFSGFRRITKEVEDINLDEYTIIASGPLTSDKLSNKIKELLGDEYLHFYDAVAPIISADSIDMNKAFFASRYQKEDTSDYLNCAMNKEEYLNFYHELITANRAELHDIDKEVFEYCMPIEVMASRGEDTIRFGPLRPVGIKNPYKDERPYAVVQLRKENVLGNAYNIVGFQTNLKFDEQKRVFSLIPGLENVEILRYGVLHRNTYINSPNVLNSTNSLKDNNKIYFAGQMTGIEGYVESIASGLMAAINLDAAINEKESYNFPNTTIIGALQRHITTKNVDYTPMNANFGLLPDIGYKIRDKKERKLKYSERSLEDLKNYLNAR